MLTKSEKVYIKNFVTGGKEVKKETEKAPMRARQKERKLMNLEVGELL